MATWSSSDTNSNNLNAPVNPVTSNVASPADGAAFTPFLPVTFSASVTSSFAISSVSYYAGSTVAARGKTGPAYAATCSCLDSGSYTVTAVALDLRGTVTTS